MSHTSGTTKLRLVNKMLIYRETYEPKQNDESNYGIK